MNFDNIEYLQRGNAKQRQAYQLLTEHNIMSSLSGFDPILVGTIPINVDTERGDIDIICYFRDQKLFRETLKKLFSQTDGFGLSERMTQGTGTVVVNVRIEGCEIEIFGQGIPTRKQLAYRHMLIEHRLLEQNGEDFRRSVVELKSKGYKTEPAFALLLGLEGDPYMELLKYERDYSN